MMQIVTHEDKQYLNFTIEQLREAGVPDSVIEEQQWQSVRRQRNTLLSESDWTLTSDSPLSTEQQQAWAAYRQLLRDLTITFSDPDAIVWPVKPTK